VHTVTVAKLELLVKYLHQGDPDKKSRIKWGYLKIFFCEWAKACCQLGYITVGFSSGDPWATNPAIAQSVLNRIVKKKLETMYPPPLIIRSLENEAELDDILNIVTIFQSGN